MGIFISPGGPLLDAAIFLAFIQSIILLRLCISFLKGKMDNNYILSVGEVFEWCQVYTRRLHMCFPH